jgi:hypothetical protein
MRVGRLAAFAASSSLALLPVAAEASNCWYPNEARAAQLRGLQTMLMVGALQCRFTQPSAVDLYNDFIGRQRAFLDANNRVLKSRFFREDGAHGARAYDRYNTGLANDYSARSEEPDRRSCWRIASLTRMATRMSEADLLMLADSVAEPPFSGACRPSDYQFGDPYEETGRFDPAGPIAEAAPPLPEPEPVLAAIEEPEPPAPPSLAPEPVLIKASEPPPAPAPSPTKEEALRAAIAALQAATAALQVASAIEEAPAPVADPSLMLEKIEEAPVVPPAAPAGG